jgi:hypothetical protein
MTVRSVIIHRPFAVVDATVRDFFDSTTTAPNLRSEWQAGSAGSSTHTVTADKDVVFIVAVRAVDTSETLVNVHAGSLIEHIAVRDTLIESCLIGIGEHFEELDRFIATIRQQAPPALSRAMTTNDLAAIAPPKKRPGPAPEPYTTWAREQARKGRSADDPTFLDEYMQQRGEDPTDKTKRDRAYDTLRKSLRRKQ